MVRIAQLVRASDCGSEGRGFESHFSPVRLSVKAAFFLFVFPCGSGVIPDHDPGSPSFVISFFFCVGLKQQRLSTFQLTAFGAEAGGFEPPVRLPVRQFSKLVVSATHPHFHEFRASFP